MKTFDSFDELFGMVCVLTTMFSVTHGSGCDAELWGLKRDTRIQAVDTSFTTTILEATSPDACRELCAQRTDCRAVSASPVLAGIKCEIHNGSVIPLSSMSGLTTYYKDYWKDEGTTLCPPTSVWEAPAGWPAEAVPSFYQPLESEACLKLSGMKLGGGKRNKGLYSPGAPHYTDIVTPEMVAQDPGRFCWLSPQNCSNGMSLGVWFRFIVQSGHQGILTTMRKHSSARPTDGFCIYLAPGDILRGQIQTETLRFVAKENNFAPVDGTWYHMGITYSESRGAKLFRDGAKVAEALPSTAADFIKGGDNPGIVRLGVVNIDQDGNYGAGTWDDIEAFDRELSPEQMAQIAE